MSSLSIVNSLFDGNQSARPKPVSPLCLADKRDTRLNVAGCPFTLSFFARISAAHEDGALYLNGGSIALDNVTFLSNYAERAVLRLEGSQGTMSLSTFRNNPPDGNAEGCVVLLTNSNISIANSTLADNSAAALCLSDSEALIDGSVMVNNTSPVCRPNARGMGFLACAQCRRVS